MATLEKAIEIASKCHAGQVDKGGNPYILHPLRMMLRAETMDEKIVCVLHDVVEDTSMTFDILRMLNFSKRILDALDALTRRESETYAEFINRAMQDDLALTVKILDVEDNLDLFRISLPTKQDYSRIKRYQKFLDILRRKQG